MAKQEAKKQAVGDKAMAGGQAGWRQDVGEEKVLMTWKSAERPFKERSRDYFTTAGALIFLFVIIFAILREFMLIMVVLALGFLAYVFAKVPPRETEHAITNWGIRTGGKIYRWSQLWRFWFEEKWGSKMLMVETRVLFPRRLMLLLGKKSEEEVKKLMVERLILEKPQPTTVDKWSNWMTEKIPLEKS